MPLFDRIVVVDWSSRSSPALGADSIWVCVLDVATGATSLDNVSTRAAASEFIAGVLSSQTDRVLVGCDFSYGYPAGLARAAALTGTSPWKAVWQHLVDHVHDEADNANDRFAVVSALNAEISDGLGPWWATTSERHVTSTLGRRKAPGFPHLSRNGSWLQEHRHTELALRRRGSHPKSTWQLAGAGSVGSQALTGIPVVARLRADERFAERSRVWPFDTGLTSDPTGGRADAIVHAEVWPSMISFDRERHAVKDAAQVLCLAEHLAGLDRCDALGALFAPSLPADIEQAVIDEEGWILGA